MKIQFQQKVSIPFFCASMLVSIAGTYFISNYFNTKKNTELALEKEFEFNNSPTQLTNNASCSYAIKRLSGYNYIKPIMFVESECESEALGIVKHDVAALIDKYKSSGVINSASVYLKDYSDNSWFGINENEEYKPGSLLKVPELIAILKMSESNPAFLNKKITYDKPYAFGKMGLYLSKTLVLGHTYTVKELLYYMIAYSDNRATALLNANIDYKIFTKIFNDFGLKTPDWKAGDYPISARNYSLFMRSLYNACYLSKDNSELATQMLSQCDFNKGIKKGLPSDIKIAHKFGESGTNTEQQLHESALIYLKNKTYLVTIMTRGTNPLNLPIVIENISYTIYKGIEATNADTI
jgi:beta-lactamase class A